MQFQSKAWSLAFLLLTTSVTSPLSQAADSLTIGSKAPQLDVEHWVSNGNGQFKPVKDFEKGKVYVVEFWATWCGPCIASMPHLAELQERYAKKGVQIISISDEPLEKVKSFLERELPGADEQEDEAQQKTYGDLTSAYCLTTDPDQGSYMDYMQAAEQSGIPTAFIVGKDSRIEWIGHPGEMDQPLEAIVSDSWDRQAFIAEMEARKELEKSKQEIFGLLNQQEFEPALKLIEKALAQTPDMQLDMLKLQILLMTEKTDEANQQLQKVLAANAKSGEATDMIAWNIYRMAMDGRIPDDKLLATAVNGAQKALAKEESKLVQSSLMDTLAHLLQQLDRIDEAIELETKAIANADPRAKEAMQEFLEELKKAK